jgi:DNA-binding NarL/FixJ family response regulator
MVVRPRVLIADDHPVMLQTLVRLLEGECEVVATARDGLAAVTAAEQFSPEVLVLDISMPGMGGIAAAAQLARTGSPARFVFVTMHHDRECVEESMTLGKIGFVIKDRLGTDLIPAIRAVLRDELFVSASLNQ